MSFDELLDAYRQGRADKDDLKRALLRETYIDAGMAKLDHRRAERTGCAEVVFCQGKTPEQVAEIMTRLAEHQPRVLGTRADRAQADAAAARLDVDYDPVSRLLVHAREPLVPLGKVVVLSAGTSDLPVAEEAARTAEFLGSRVLRHYDCGVAGLHRLFPVIEELRSARAVVCVAGMEGALASVAGGLCPAPVIAVPTSVGYGASYGGLAALLAMLNSCAPGVCTVNIDNGFGAGYLAHRMNTLAG
ncbi:nickel pincer cofactor biosynthesis protein LarB [Desulfovibrio aminophilus]|nr:nickel pincer cofactor biosynthesis protein LarB [Desulfovibrio aminophilus]MCM0754603.1 nickel pincer cofactor biosynthesis protein LarB [Desulfovibrio aminophilus]